MHKLKMQQISESTFTLLPFQFKRIDDETLLVANECGDFHFLTKDEFDNLVSGSLLPESNVYNDLLSKHFIAEENIALPLELIATKYRSRKRFLQDFTALHMMVTTLRCNQACNYCQVSSADEKSIQYDMTPRVARKITAYIFCSPSSHIKIEFQGGEPTLNWRAIVETVIFAKKLNEKAKKHLEFALCTNLIGIDEDKLAFLKEHNISISTSLDGDRLLHDSNRILRNGKGTYDIFLSNLELARKIVGEDKVSALATLTVSNLNRFKEITNEYLRLGFRGLFFRGLNPYGDAAKRASQLGYPIEHYLENYKKCVDYLINLNLQGQMFVEFYTALLLSRILTPFSTGFVDLQSPSGAGISGAIYDHNGDVYPADEARMLSRMGDGRFLMGNVLKDSYLEIFQGKVISEIVEQSCVECLPGCASCVYQSYCGADPIRNYLETNDIVGHRPSSDFCKKNYGMLSFLFDKIRQNDRDTMDVFWSWITKTPIQRKNNETV